MADSIPATVAPKMEELRQKCDSDVAIQTHGIVEFTNLFHGSMESVLQRTHESIAYQAELGKLKAKLREEEAALVKAIADKTRKEARKMTLMDSLSSSRARSDELDRILQDRRARRDKYSAFMAQQCRALLDVEEKKSQNSEVQHIQEAISWYDRSLGFRIECGHGVNFTFTNVNANNPNDEFSITIRHSNDTYTVLGCDPHLDGIEQLVQDLNKTNELYKFVTTIRQMFVEAAESGLAPQPASSQQEASVITISTQVSLDSAYTKSDSQTVKSMIEKKSGEVKRESKKLHERGGGETILSPSSASLPRRSPRIMHSRGPRA